jgi:hypothetical protein
MNRFEIVMRKYGWLISAVAIFGCTQPNPAYDPDPYLPGECREGVEVTETFDSYERPEKLDVLFVMDDSGDVSELQEMAAASIPKFAVALEGTGVDARVAVTTSGGSGEPTLSGAVTEPDGCEDNDVAVADTSDSGWAQAVACNLQQGEDGDPIDQPLGVIDAHLDAGSGNEFFRADARLLVVVFAKSDDCTHADSSSDEEVCSDDEALVDVADMVTRWRASRVTTDSLGLAVFAGPPSDVADDRRVCNATIGSVDAGNRLSRAAYALDEQGFFSSVCTDDVSTPLTEVVERFVDGATTTICPAAALVHEPLSVVATIDGDQESIPLGADGFVYLGATELCEEGALEFAGDSLWGAEQIDLEYCTLP